MKKHSSEKSNNNKVSEPSTTYSDLRRITIFNSFEDAKSSEYLQIIKQDPIQRLRETVSLILRAYGINRELLNSRKTVNKIIVTQSG